MRAPTHALSISTRGARVQSGSSAVTVQTSRVRHVATASATDLSLLYVNWNAGEVPGAGDVTVKAAIEIGPAIHTVFFRGARTAQLAPGGWVQSDPLGVAVGVGDVVWVHTTRTTTSSAPNVLALRASSGEGRADADLADRDAVAVVADEATPAYGPLALPAGAGASTAVAVIGDSISNGVGETVREDGGYLARALASDIALIRLNNGSGTARVYGDPSTTNAASGRRRMALASAATAAWVEFGINDLGATDATLELVQDSLSRVWQNLALRGLSIYQSTITPNTSTTDAWSTVENQTPFGGEAMRVALNAWIRSRPAPLAGYFEAADQAETARDSGLWRPGYTADGIHPTSTGHAAIAAGVRSAVASAFAGRVTPPGAVGGLAVASGGPETLSVTWDPVPDVVGYEVRYRIEGTADWAQLSATEAGATIAGLQPDTGYEVAVRAVGAGGVGEWSATITGRTDVRPIPDLPTDGLLARWNVEDLRSAGDGAVIGVWTDRVAGYPLSASSSRRPVLRTDGARARLVFDGVDDFMDGTGLQVPGATSEVVVCRLVTTRPTVNQVILSAPSSVSSSGRRQLYARGAGTESDFVATAGTVLSSRRAADTEWHAVGARFLVDGGRGGEVRVDDTSATGTLGTYRRDGLRVGASSSSVAVAMEVVEVLVYGPTSASTWSQVFAHLRGAHDLPG